MSSHYFILSMEIVATMAFASAGALTAIRKNLDLFGVILIGVVASVGGGCIRDIILGINPPLMFTDPTYSLVAFITSLMMFVIVGANPQVLRSSNFEKFEQLINVLDAIGLGAFTVIGINTAIGQGYGDFKFLLCFVGVTTGVGGGVLKDVMVGVVPAILRKHIYAMASCTGALACVFSIPYIGLEPGLALGGCITFAIRMLATFYKWNFPKISYTP